MERFVKVNLPVDSPDDTLALCKKIVAKDLLLGAASPLLNFVDMVDFEAKRANALQKQSTAEIARQDSEAFNGQAKTACGISQGQNKQTKQTLYWYSLQSRDVLLLKNRGVEQNLEQWGYHVVISQTGSRRNVRVEIPNDSPEGMTKLCEDIIAKHVLVGAGSPLTANVDMVDFGAKTTAARTLINNGEQARIDKEAFHGQALTIIGYSQGQTSETPGTLYFDLIAIRDRLLQVNQDEEQNLEQWGFDVQISEAAVGGSGGGGGAAAGLSASRAGNIAGGGTVVNIPIADLVFGDNSMVELELDGVARAYGAVNAIAVPGPNDTFWDAPATTTNKSAAEFGTLTGISEEKPLLNFQNNGASTVHYKITFTGLENPAEP